MTENVLIRVCDDDEDVRRSWQFVLEGEGWNVRIYPDALTFLKEDDPLVPGCLILDVRMPGMTGIELQHEMALRSHVLPVIFVSGHGDINMAVKTIKDGAEDFLPKPVETLRLIVIQKAQSAWRQLSEREKEVARGVADGLLNKQIAFNLGITEKTVIAHRGSILALAGALCLRAAVLMAGYYEPTLL